MVTLDALVVGDDPEAWAAAGFAVVDDHVVVAAPGSAPIRIHCAGDGGGSDRWTLRCEVDLPGDVDGITTKPSTAPVPEEPTHPNGVVSLDHVVLRSPDLDRTTEALGALGIEARRTRDTSVGDRPIRQRFFRLGGVILELVGPPAPSGDGPASIWGYAFVSEDIDASAAFLGDRCSEPKTAVQPGRRIATVRTRDLGISVAVALMTPHIPRAG